MKKLNSKGFTAVEVMLVIIVIVVLGGVGYYVTSKIDKSNNASKTQQESQPAAQTPVAQASVNEGIIAGQVDTNRGDGLVTINAVFKNDLNVKEIWVDYGLSPDKLTSETSRYSKGLGEGDSSQAYGYGVQLVIQASSLTPGEHYFYRVSAKIGDKTEHGAIASFTAAK